MEWITSRDQLREHGNFSLPDFKTLKFLLECPHKVVWDLSVLLDDIGEAHRNVLVPLCSQENTEWSLGLTEELIPYSLERDYAYMFFVFSGKGNLTVGRSEWDFKAKTLVLIPKNKCRMITFDPETAFYFCKTQVTNASQQNSPFVPKEFSLRQHYLS